MDGMRSLAQGEVCFIFCEDFRRSLLSSLSKNGQRRAKKVGSLKEKAGPREAMQQITIQQIAMHQEVYA
jgi:hypothetical protein